VPDHVYRTFGPGDLFQARVRAEPTVYVESGSTGWSGNSNGPSGSISLYTGIRSRTDVYSGSTSGIQIYPLDLVDTYSIDKVIGIPGSYPQTGSISVVTCADTTAAETATSWTDRHYRPLSLLSNWYHDFINSRYSTTASLPSTVTVVNIPSLFYGRNIATGSVFITDKTYAGSGTLTFIDDGRGSLILSGTNVASGTYGNVFYNEGFIVFTSHSLGAGGGGSDPRLHIEFRAVNIIVSKVAMCRMGPGDVNASNNPTFYTTDQFGQRIPKRQGKTYVSSIGIYNEERELVAVAKLAQPIRKRDADDLDIRLRIDI
jgi:hypothetical protein